MMLFKLNFMGMLLLQEAIGFDLRSMWAQMGLTAKAVVVLLALMSMWSFGVMVDRYIAFSQARKQSREFAPAVAGCLKEGKIEEAISVAEQSKRSHLAKVVEAGLQEFRSQGVSSDLSGEQIESSRRACERAEAIVNAELKRGLSGLATIGATAPFVGLFGTTVGIINAFQGMSSEADGRSFCSCWWYFRGAGRGPRLVSSLRFPRFGRITRSPTAWKPSRSR